MGDSASGPGEVHQARVIALSALEREMGKRADLAAVDTIFFAASQTQSFASSAAKEAFRERWLGRYLEHYRENFFLAIDPRGRIAGYLAGCLVDPSRQGLFADIAYFAEIADLTRDYPAHLHINVDASWRNRGIGALLIEAFCAHAAKAGAPGVHVVTGAHSRNGPFYARNGFRRLRSLLWNGAEIVCLGRRLSA